ncbi:hypothetical protein, partial [Peribacillus frigoritolerans]|uniref:hypothetical protein n=1 Tax=Peribacillus frigoritolerans TaxID=450367 RepID=UPI002E1A1D1C|nr:hypothetical protein [Peribacillus frigoritolerans]
EGRGQTASGKRVPGVEINVRILHLVFNNFKTEKGTLNNRRMMSRTYGLYLFLLTFKIGTEANRRN